MKYIRTKDGRIAEIKENMFVKQSDVLRLVYKDRPYSCVLNGNDEIIKEADTIEELCDDFVYSDEVFKNVIYNNFHALKILLKLRKNYVVYGAVWCDKGLIYVAKMNEKGDLELL